MRKLPLRGRWQAEGGEKISDFQVLLSLSVEGDRAPALLFFLALYRFQNVTHFIYCIISSCFFRLPPLRTRNPAAKETTILNKIPPKFAPPPNQGWSRAKAKTRHFPLLDLGVEWEGYNFPIHDVQDCRSVQDDTKSLWFIYVKGCYYTHKHNTSPILFFFFFCRLTYDDVQRLVVESKATNVRSDGTPFLAMILCSKRFDPEKENEKHNYWAHHRQCFP